MKKTQQYLIDLLAHTDNPSQLSGLLEAIMTEKELEEIINRIKIFSYLQQGLPQREISVKLGVGIATVSRGAKAYRHLPIDELFPNLDKIIVE